MLINSKLQSKSCYYFYLSKMILTLKSLKSIQVRTTEQKFHVVLFLMVYKMVLNFKPMDEKLS